MEIFEPGSVKSYDLIWREILDDREMTVLKAQGCDLDGPLSVYAIRDSVGTVVYVGKSKTVLWRLAQHIGLGGFPSGTEIGKYLIPQKGHNNQSRQPEHTQQIGRKGDGGPASQRQPEAGETDQSEDRDEHPQTGADLRRKRVKNRVGDIGRTGKTQHHPGKPGKHVGIHDSTQNKRRYPI